jgi:hypothetical protein
MWIAALSAATTTAAFCGDVISPHETEHNSSWHDLEIYVFTFAIGYLVLQLCAFLRKPAPSREKGSRCSHSDCVLGRFSSIERKCAGRYRRSLAKCVALRGQEWPNLQPPRRPNGPKASQGNTLTWSSFGRRHQPPNRTDTASGRGTERRTVTRTISAPRLTSTVGDISVVDGRGKCTLGLRHDLKRVIAVC